MEFLTVPSAIPVINGGHVPPTYPLILDGNPLVRACAWCGQDFAWKTPRTKRQWLGLIGHPQRYCSRACNAQKITTERTVKNRERRKRVCLGCGGTFPAADFFQRADGRWGLYCRPCGEKKAAEGYSNPETYLVSTLASARRRAAKANRTFTLTIEWLRERAEFQRWLCHYTGRRMLTMYGRGRIAKNLSIDRIDSAAGYTVENVVLCCVDINLAKQWYPISHLVDLAHMVTKWCPPGKPAGTEAIQ